MPVPPLSRYPLHGPTTTLSPPLQQWFTSLVTKVNDIAAGNITTIDFTTTTLIGVVPVVNGGTGLSTLAVNRIPYGNGTSAFQSDADLTFDGSTLTLNGLYDISGAAGGQIQFPATQNPSADLNTFDDYQETPSWTPTVTFATPGDLVVVYALRTGVATRFGNVTVASCDIVTSTFTHTTAVGALRVTGLPTAPTHIAFGALQYGGITKAGFTDFVASVAITTGIVNVIAMGSGVAGAIVNAGDVPTGGTVVIRFTVAYI